MSPIDSDDWWKGITWHEECLKQSLYCYKDILLITLNSSNRILKIITFTIYMAEEYNGFENILRV
jgi:hypothetical protein